MAIHEPDSHWWSDIFQTEFRRPQKPYRRFCMLPSQCARVGPSPHSQCRKTTKAFLVKVCGFFGHNPPAASAVSCVDPLVAHMHACIAATFFCYVSPTIYGLTASNDERGVTQLDNPPGDTV